MQVTQVLFLLLSLLLLLPPSPLPLLLLLLRHQLLLLLAMERLTLHIDSHVVFSSMHAVLKTNLMICST
jgi:hypothetical protein